MNTMAILMCYATLVAMFLLPLTCAFSLVVLASCVHVVLSATSTFQPPSVHSSNTQTPQLPILHLPRQKKNVEEEIEGSKHAIVFDQSPYRFACFTVGIRFISKQRNVFHNRFK